MKAKRPEKRLVTGSGDVRCSCGALMFRASGPVSLEMKCRRCGLIWQYATSGCVSNLTS
jgi:hypothetical protein